MFQEQDDEQISGDLRLKFRPVRHVSPSCVYLFRSGEGDLRKRLYLSHIEAVHVLNPFEKEALDKNTVTKF